MHGHFDQRLGRGFVLLLGTADVKAGGGFGGRRVRFEGGLALKLFDLALVALVERLELLFGRGPGQPLLLMADLPLAIPGEGVEGGRDWIDVEEVDGRDAEERGEKDARADLAERVGDAELDDVTAEDAAGAVDVVLVLNEAPAADVLEVEQGADADEKEQEPDGFPPPLDLDAEEAGAAAAEGKEREEVGAEAEAQVEQAGQARADVADEVGGIRVGRIGVEAEIARVVGEEGQKRDDVERKPEDGGDLLEEREGGEIPGPGQTLRDGTTRHAIP